MDSPQRAVGGTLGLGRQGLHIFLWKSSTFSLVGVALSPLLAFRMACGLNVRILISVTYVCTPHTPFTSLKRINHSAFSFYSAKEGKMQGRKTSSCSMGQSEALIYGNKQAHRSIVKHAQLRNVTTCYIFEYIKSYRNKIIYFSDHSLN